MNLPLPISVTRCLAKGLRKGETCIKADSCERHVTIRHDDGLWDKLQPPVYRACADERLLCFMPMRPAGVMAAISYPVGSLGEEAGA